MKLEPVPGEYRPPGLVKEPVYYIDVEKKLASKVIDVTKRIAPPRGPMMQHIKRVKPSADNPQELSILVCETSRYSVKELKDALSSHLDYDVDIKYSIASKYPARTAEEALEWGKEVWPMMWRGNIKAKAPEMLDEDESYAIAILKGFSETADKSSCCDQCKVVDPQTRNVVGVGVSNTLPKRHPLKHAVMGAIECVANHERQGQAEANEENVYLCVGMDVFCSQEPCVMCCMALIHSRINRLFYLSSSPSQKGPLERYCLHARTQLNHTYEVWRPIHEST